LKQGDEVYMNLSKIKTRIQQVSVYKGAQRVVIEEVSAGNIVGPATVEVIFAIASTCLSMALMDLFNEEPKKTHSQK